MIHYKDLEKVERLLNNTDKHFQDQPWTVLLTSGSFSPLHLMHVKILEVAKEHLEKTMNILCCVLAPSSDSHVLYKLGKTSAILLKDRSAICYQVANNYNWLTTFTLGNPSAEFSMHLLHSIFQKSFPNEEFKFIEVCGGDHCEKFELWKYPLVCVSRPSYEPLITEALKSGKDVHQEFVYVEDNRVSSISSTLIRKTIISRSSALNDLLFPETIQYLKQMNYLGLQ